MFESYARSYRFRLLPLFSSFTQLALTAVLCLVSVTLAARPMLAQTDEWRWMGGSSTVGSNGGQPGVYGTQGVYAAANIPGSREYATHWNDGAGNLWLFGGCGFDSSGSEGCLDDLWEYSPSSGQWRWMGGSSIAGQSGTYGTQGTYAVANIPGGRVGAVSWTDAGGNLLLFGGQGYDSSGNFGALNDLWEYSPSQGQWRWLSGSSTLTLQDSNGNYFANGVYGLSGAYGTGNIPGSRVSSVSWVDSSGDLWLFGGYGFDSEGTAGALNDLWEYSPTAGEWRWMGGSSTLVLQDTNGNYYASGVYGTAGSYAAVNVPGGREWALSWRDSSGNLWLFGGSGDDSSGNPGDFNDLWEYSVTLGQWRWMSGSSTIGGSQGQPGVLGTMGGYAAANTPGNRDSATAWADSGGNLWLFGGGGYDANGVYDALNDLWEYNLTLCQWRWMGGGTSAAQPGVYGTQGSYAQTNIAGSRWGAVSWIDGSGNAWLFGGMGYDSTDSEGFLNDLWELSLAAGVQGPPTITSASGATFVVGTAGTFTVTATGTPAPTLSESGALPGGVTFNAATGVLSGTPAAGTAGSYPLTFAATNGVSPDAAQSFTLTVQAAAPAITSASSATFVVGTAGTFTVTATGTPVPTLSESGALPGGVSFNAATGVLSGTPAAGTAGSYPLTFTATNGVTPNATQSFTLTVLAVPPGAQTNQWRWMSGSSAIPLRCVNSGSCGQNGSYGVIGAYAVGNSPGSRVGASSWSDTGGNLWLFGGQGYDSSGKWGELNDLWEYSPSLAQWRWVGGSNAFTQENLSGSYYGAGVYGTLGSYAAGNVPSGRDGAMSWVDLSGNFWLFGGEGFDAGGISGDLSDLWEYNPSLGQWRWVSGSSTLGPGEQPGVYGTEGSYAAGNGPGGRFAAVSWSDTSGNLWLFGGTGYDSASNLGYLNDLWEFNIALGQWRWMSGSNILPACTGGAGCGGAGIYGVEGTYAASDVPGGRSSAVGWVDAAGNLWLFGGDGYDSNASGGALSDLWEYSPASGQWRWVSGNTTVDQPGVYGTKGTYAAGNLPGGSASAIAWGDASGTFWLLRGFGYDSAGSGGYLNDLWEYSTALGEWRWMSGSNTLAIVDSSGYYYVPGVYGTQGSYAANNVPGSRQQGVSWTDASGNLWLFGGSGYGSGGASGWLNDLWEFSPAPSPTAPTITSANSAVFVAGMAGTVTIAANGTPAPTLTESGALPGGVTFSSPSSTLTGSLPGGVTFNTTTGVLSGKPAAGSEGTYTLTFTASNSSGPNATQSFTLAVLGPAAISNLSPATAVAGGAGFMLTVNGSNFVSGAGVLWNGAALTTTYVSASQLTATVPASLIANAGTVMVRVQESGSNSAPVAFTTIPAVAAALPVLLSMTPSTATAGAAGMTLTVNGANFNSGSVVLWNGSPRATTFVNSSQLQANVTTLDLAAEGTAMVTVATKSPAGISSAVPFIVQSSTSIATIRSVTVANTATGGGYPASVSGMDFVSTSVLYWGATAAMGNNYGGDGWLFSLLPSATRPATVFVVSPLGDSPGFEIR